jgi:phospholipase C
MLAGVAAGAGAASASAYTDAPALKSAAHLVVIYEENHSFDNLYGGWEGVNGLRAADSAHTTQVSQAGTAYNCLLQNDVNLTSPSPLPSTCSDSTTGTAFESAFGNEPFAIDDYIKPSDTTCPAPGTFAPHGVPNGSGLPGGCTEDLVHRFYQEQYQWGPGTRIPALIVSPGLQGKFVVDHTEHDTTSILATIDHVYGLEPLGIRDAAVPDLFSIFSAGQAQIPRSSRYWRFATWSRVASSTASWSSGRMSCSTISHPS